MVLDIWVKTCLGSGRTIKIHIHAGAGAYICGEETALLESLEGKRGMPRFKPPFPATHGLYQKPTVVNNVETMANIPHIINRGGGMVCRHWLSTKELRHQGFLFKRPCETPR